VDSQLVSRFRVAGATLLILSAICFVLNLSVIAKTPSQMSPLHVALSVVFWLSVIAFYATFYAFHRANRPYNTYSGNGRLGSALTVFILALAVGYLQFHVESHMNLYETLLVTVASITYGATILILCFLSIARRRFRSTRESS
jgi:drug/metabolite transporter (DMT)-like permease